MFESNGLLAEVSEKINFITEIKWFFAYGVFQGTIKDSESAISILGRAKWGEFKIRSAELSGSQETTISWYRDEGDIKFRVLGVTAPKQ